ncbi:MAG: glycine--tRNA ligase subunit beta, partial [Rhodobacterales bacterium]|nr:glycine--tRNA ligase subunit beta [Rhodobacterales bacterium]
GVDVADLQIVDGPKGKVIAALVSQGGASTRSLLAEGLAAVIAGIPFKKSMEWGNGGLRWGRPLHYISCILDGQPVSGALHDVAFGNQTVGHRLSGEPFTFSCEDDWLSGLRSRDVEPDLRVRETQIRSLLEHAAKRVDGDEINDDGLVEEVLHLVESPTLVLGTFNDDLLNLPPKLLVESMKKHQRYFPIYKSGKLSNHFAVISNNPHGDEATVADGNARVLRARFDDARFFLAEDKKKTLEQHGAGLTKMRWIRGMGSMASKQQRISSLASQFAPTLGADAKLSARAGVLCKADLVSAMVNEFPGLQGHMGTLYARDQGEDESVALAVEGHYAPSGGRSPVATEPVSVTLAVADRVDTLACCFGIGMRPKGGDPQGLRRAALGIVRTLVENKIRVNLADLFTVAIDTAHATSLGANDYEAWTKARGTDATAQGRDALVAELITFASTRFKAWSVAQGATPDQVDAVLAVSVLDPLALHHKVTALKALSGHPNLVEFLDLHKRVQNVTKGQSYPPPTTEQFTDPNETAGHAGILRGEGSLSDVDTTLDYGTAMGSILELQQPIADLFVSVMVNDKDPAVKAVRVGLLLRVSAAFRELADFSRISTR